MNPATATRKLATLLRTRGFNATADVVMRNVREWYWQHENARFDRRHGTDTGGSIESPNLQITSRNVREGVRYEPTTLRTFDVCMSHLPSDLSDFTFVDFGSGKGRVLLLASRHRFRAIVGIEYARDLHEIATRNIERYRDSDRRCADVRSLHGDATEFEIPPTPCVFYFFQPFAGTVLETVIDRVGRSIADQPRPAYLVFIHPHPTLDRRALQRFASLHVRLASFRDLAWRHDREIEIWSAPGGDLMARQG